MSSHNSAFISATDFSFSAVRERDNKMFMLISVLFLLLTMALAIVVQMTKLPELTRAEREKVPAQLTRIIERVKIKPKPKVKVQEPEKKEEPKVEEKKKIEPEKKKIVVKKPIKKPVTKLERATERAKNSGLLAMVDDLALMRDTINLPLNNKKLVKNRGQTKPSLPTSATKKFKGKSASLGDGVVTQTATKRISLADRNLVAVKDKVVDTSDYFEVATEQTQSANITGERNTGSFRRVLDRNKGAFYTIYRRALRKDPALEGKVTMLIVVEPNGAVSSCKVTSSELSNAKLERKLIARMKLINFGQEDVVQTSFNYTFNFLPY
ncbi:MAG: AgmX/PglI C-terminal domain-containing protein [Psychrobium sp.]|nr:AgmX/PglI C-terminal domain-containing protein [Psychrobium sp.]